MKIVFFILLIPFCFLGQDKSGAFNLLLNMGVTPAQVHGDAYSGFHKVGFTGGVGVESVFSDKIKMSLSFLFIQKGARKNQNPQKNDFTSYYLNLNYVEVPLLLTYTSNNKYIFDLGVSAGYLINYYESTEIGNMTGNYPFQKFEYSVKVGLGYNINPKWFVNFRSSNSFITIRPNYTKQAIYYNNLLARLFNKGYYNNILEFTLGYRIKTKK